MKLRKGCQDYLRLVQCCLIILAFVTSGCEGIRVHKVVVPPHEIKGQGVNLECQYDMEDEQLYSVKWYKGIKEFFRYVPADTPPIQVFDLPGVNVDVDRSTNRRVVLKEISLRTSGKYKCEVSAEAPSFHTDSGTGELLVVHIPKIDPVITGLQLRYHVGDPVQVNCTSAPSKPAAALTWYIQEQQADSKSLIDYAPVSSSDGLEKSILGLHFRAQLEHLKSGHLKLRCTATIAAVYFLENTVYARAKLTARTERPKSHSMYAGEARKQGVVVWPVVVAGVVGLALLR